MTIRQRIFPDERVAGLIDAIVSMPERIRKQQDLLADAKLRLDAYNEDDLAAEEVAMYEGEAMFEVLNEVNGDGKKKYTNDTQRKEAAKKALRNNQDYMAAVTRLVNAKRQKAELKNHEAKLNNQVGAAVGESFALRAVAEIVAGLSREDATQREYTRINNALAAIDRFKQTLSDLPAVKE